MGTHRRPGFVRVSYFVWLVAPALLFAAYRLYGLPHVIWSYDFYGSHADWSARRYTRCTFVGPYGEFTTYPANERCGWIAFFHGKEADQ